MWADGVGRVLRRDAVGVLGRIETAAAICHLAHDVLKRVRRHVQKEPVARHLRALDVREHELRLVVEHLLEMRHPPRRVDRIAMKAAADVVAHAAECHRAERPQHHVAGEGVSCPRVLAQQEQQLRWTRELRRVAEPAVSPVEDLVKLRHGAGEGRGVRNLAAGCRCLDAASGGG